MALPLVGGVESPPPFFFPEPELVALQGVVFKEGGEEEVIEGVEEVDALLVPTRLMGTEAIVISGVGAGRGWGVFFGTEGQKKKPPPFGPLFFLTFFPLLSLSRAVDFSQLLFFIEYVNKR